MAKYINAELLEAEQYKGFNRVNETDWQKGYWTGIDEMCEKIKEQPTADVVEVIHGMWIEHKYAEESEGLLISNYECNQCHSWKREESEYCSECGAKMDGKKVE